MLVHAGQGCWVFLFGEMRSCPPISGKFDVKVKQWNDEEVRCDVQGSNDALTKAS